MRNIERKYRIKYLEPLKLPYSLGEVAFVRTNLGIFTSKEGALKYLHYLNDNPESLARVMLINSQLEKKAA